MKKKKEVVTMIRARATESDQKAWQVVAKKEGKSFAQWVRDSLNKAIGRIDDKEEK